MIEALVCMIMVYIAFLVAVAGFVGTVLLYGVIVYAIVFVVAFVCAVSNAIAIIIWECLQLLNPFSSKHSRSN